MVWVVLHTGTKMVVTCGKCKQIDFFHYWRNSVWSAGTIMLIIQIKDTQPKYLPLLQCSDVIVCVREVFLTLTPQISMKPNLSCTLFAKTRLTPSCLSNVLTFCADKRIPTTTIQLEMCAILNKRHTGFGDWPPWTPAQVKLILHILKCQDVSSNCEGSERNEIRIPRKYILEYGGLPGCLATSELCGEKEGGGKKKKRTERENRETERNPWWQLLSTSLAVL